MAMQGLETGLHCNSSSQFGRTSFLDFKLKRRRVSEIIASAKAILPSGSDTDVQSNVSGDSGYGSHSERVSKGKLQEQSVKIPDGDVFNICKQEQKCVEDFLARLPNMENQLIVPNVSSSKATNVHIGVAYLTYTKSGVKPVTGLNGEVKMGLIPVLSSNKALMSLSLNGLSGFSDGDLPKGVQPLFLTSVPNGFEVPDLDLSQSQSTRVAESSNVKMPSNQSMKSPSHSRHVMTIDSESAFIEHYTNGLFEYLGHLGDKKSCDSMSVLSKSSSARSDTDSVCSKDSSATLTYDNKYPMVCGICNDRATGLHYGIITCEGCKGFFKRTVQNRRVYTCVGGGGECEINKAQRNRCQHCRFKKCLQAGMVLAAVREDRMPGGRNSGEVYNLYKVKYKKHRRREETKISKEKVACISANDNQITVEPIRSRPKFETVLQLPCYDATSMSGLNGGPRLAENFFTSSMADTARSSHCLSQASIESLFNMIYGGFPMETGTRVSMSTVNPGEEQLYIEDRSPKRPRLESSKPVSLLTNPGMKAMSESAGYSHGNWAVRSSGSVLENGMNRQYYNQGFCGKNVVNVKSEHETNSNGFCHEAESDSQKSDSRFAYFVKHIANKHSPAISKESTVCMRCSKEKNNHCVCSHVARLVNHHSVLRRTLTSPDTENEKHFSKAGSQFRSMPEHRTNAKSDIFVSQCSGTLISELMDCDAKLTIIESYNLPELFNDGTNDITKLLCDLGDKVVGKLVLWTKTLPFFREIPIEIHSKLLSSKWQELLLFIATAHRAIYEENDVMSFGELYSFNMGKLKYYLEHLLKREFTTGQLESDLREIMQHITELMHGFVTMAILPEEYVCMLVILLLNQEDEDRSEVVTHFLEKYCMALRDFEVNKCPNQSSRFQELIKWVPKVQAASALLISSKMIYIPFFLNC